MILLLVLKIFMQTKISTNNKCKRMKRSSFIKIGALSVLCCILSSACSSGSKSNQSTASSEESAMPEESVKEEYIPEGWESIWNHIDFKAETEDSKTLCFKITSPSTCMVTYQDLANNADYVFGTVTIPAHVKWKGEVFAVTGINDHSFVGCKNLGKIILPETIKDIGYRPFQGCNSLVSVKLPNSLTEIGDWLFDSCELLESVNIPNSVTSIGKEAFYKCRSLASIELPKNLTKLGNGAFSSCSGLTSITIPNSVTSIGKGAFQN